MYCPEFFLLCLTWLNKFSLKLITTILTFMHLWFIELSMKSSYFKLSMNDYCMNIYLPCVLSSWFLNNCNGAEGTHEYGDLLQIRTCSSDKGGNQGKPRYPSHPWNKQTSILWKFKCTWKWKCSFRKCFTSTVPCIVCNTTLKIYG